LRGSIGEGSTLAAAEAAPTVPLPKTIKVSSN
jgi:hypothetical protein